MKRFVVACSLVAMASVARADSLADALRRRDIAGLRTRLDDVAARCALGAVYGQTRDLSRAALFLDGCADATLPEDIGPEVRRVERDVRKQLRDSDYAVLEIVTRPAGMTGALAALPGEHVATPATIYVRPGVHVVTATGAGGVVVTREVVAEPRSRVVVILEAPIARAPAAPGTGTVDFGEENAGDTQAGPPPDVKHKNMMRDKYLRGVTATGETHSPDAIDDPMAAPALRRPRAYRVGLRVGGGMFDGDAGFSAALVGRTHGRAFVAGRGDYARGDGFVAYGASLGAGYSFARHVAASAQLAAGSAVYVSAAAGLEVDVPRTPLAFGVRAAQGLTANERSFVLELGVDWR